MAMRRQDPVRIGDQAASMHPGGDQVVPFDLSGGVDRSRAPNEIPANALRYGNNCYYPRESLMPRTRPGSKAWMAWSATPGTMPTGRISAMYVYAKTSTQSYLIMATFNAAAPGNPTDQYLWYVDLSAGAPYTPGYLRTAAGSPVTLGSTTPPTFATMNGKLLIAVAGQYLKEWSGTFTAQGQTAARATGSVTVGGGNVQVGDWVTIGERTFTFYSDAVAGRPGEVLIGGTADLSAIALKAAIDAQCTEVRATGITNGTIIGLQVRRTGAAGNSTTLTSSGSRLTCSAFSSGVNGMDVDIIDTYDAPKGGILLPDKNGRLVVAGCTTNPDRVYFSRAGNPYDWRVSPFGAAQRWDIGFLEGNIITAVAPFYDELWVHKRGADCEIYRARIADPTPETWELQWRPHEQVTAAIGPRCARTLAGKHVALDPRAFLVFTGDETYNEIRSEYEGTKVEDLIGAFDRWTVGNGEAFIAVNPREGYALVFPRFGDLCLCYHYGSGRWTTWRFAYNVSAALYCEPLGIFLLATIDPVTNEGTVRQLDETIATDVYNENPASALPASVAFSTQIDTRTLDAGVAAFVHKQAVLDLENVASGVGSIQIVANRNEDSPRDLGTFSIDNSELLVFNATMLVYNTSTMYFVGTKYARAIGYATAQAEMMSYRILFTGSAIVNGFRVRLAQHGRGTQ